MIRSKNQSKKKTSPRTEPSGSAILRNKQRKRQLQEVTDVGREKKERNEKERNQRRNVCQEPGNECLAGFEFKENTCVP